jgi:hypothetical protein
MTEKNYLASRALEDLANFYNYNQKSFQRFEKTAGIDIWFLNHFRLYFIYRNKFYEIENDIFSKSIGRSLFTLSLGFIKELSQVVTGYIKPKRHNLRAVIISNARDVVQGVNVRFNGIEYPQLYNRPFFDLKNDGIPNVDKRTYLFNSDSIILNYILTGRILPDTLNFFRSFSKLKDQLDIPRGNERLKDLKILLAANKGYYFLMFLKFRAFQLFFQRNDIDKILLSDENSPQQRVIQCAALSCGTEVLAFQHGNIHDFHPAYIYGSYVRQPVLPTFTFTWGSYFTSLLVSSGGYSQESVITLGRLLPAVATTINTELEGLNGFLLFATQPQRDRSLRYNTIRDVMSVLKKVQIDKKLVIRPHPKEKDDTLYYRASLETGYTDFIIDRITDLQSHFELCDTLIVSFSTVGTEFISHFKPMIVFDYNKQDLMGWIKNQVGIPVYEKEDFQRILLDSPNSIDKLAYEKFIQKYYLTGDSTIDKLNQIIHAT